MSIIGTSFNGKNVYSHPESHLHFDGELLVEVIGKLTLEGTYHFETVDMGRNIGFDHLVKTNEYSSVFYMERPFSYSPLKLRAGKSRMTFDSPERTRFVTIGLCVCNEEGDPNSLNGKWCVFTVFEGKPGEKEPWDRAFADNKNPEGLSKAIRFWEGENGEGAHALALTDDEMKYVRAKLEDDDEFFQDLYKRCKHDLCYMVRHEVVDDRDDLHAFSCTEQMAQEELSFETPTNWFALVRVYEDAYDDYSQNSEHIQAYYY